MEATYQPVLSRILNRYSPVGQPSVELIMENGTLQSVRKNDIVFHEKRFNAFEYFQLQGVSHRFNINEEQEQVTSGIYQNEIVITPHFTRTTDNQSIFSLQALTDCTYLKVPAGIFREISDQDQPIRQFGRAVVEKEFVRSLQFEVLFRTYHAKERLMYFRANYPGLENIIPHSVIASFLGITSVSFSRLRKELTKK